MRKSGRLASIHEDDDSAAPSSNPTSANTKKFTPTIPAVRRKKVVEEDQSVGAAVTEKPAPVDRIKPNQNSRRPLNVPAPANVSGPLSLGPASMPRSSRPSSGSSGSSGSISGLSARTFSRLNNSAAQSSNPLTDSVPIEEEFSYESLDTASESSSAAAVVPASNDSLLKPIVLLDVTKEINETFTHFEPEPGKLFLFQMPPILPSLLNHQHTIPSSDHPPVEAEKWPSTAQGRYGKLRRYKSGRITMVLENGVEFIINSSIESADTKNTSLLAIDPEFGQSFNLGPIQGKFVAIPDFDKFQKI